MEMFKINLIYKKATINDLDILTSTRIEVLRSANDLSADVDMSEVKNNYIIIKNITKT